MLLRGFGKRAVSAAVSAALVLSLVTVLPVPAANAADTVVINMGKEYQTIKGFGGMNCPDWGVDLTETACIST